MENLNLSEIIDTRDEQPPIWVASPWGSFEVLLRPQTGKQQEFLEEATELAWDLGTMKKVPKVDRDKYLRLFGTHHIVDWKGLDVATLKKLVLIKNWRKLKGKKGEVGCDEKSIVLLLTFSAEFNAWVNQTSINIELFNREREEEAEKK